MATLKGTDKVMAAIEAIAKRMGGGNVEVGFIDGATYPDGTPVAAVAFWNEYGDPAMNRPPRSFFRQMIAKESPGWPKKMAALAKATDYDGPRVLGLMGEDIQGALIQGINDLTSPGLAPSTIAAKGFAKPLIDTAVMVNGTGYKVNE